MTKVETEIIMPEIAVGDDFGQAMELAEQAAISRDAQWAREEDIKVEQNRILAREGMRHVYVLNPEGNYVVKRFRSIGEAAIQRDTMNTLYDVLRYAECPVSAVRVLAMASNGVLPPAAVIERAPGGSINSQFMPEQAYFDRIVSCRSSMMEELKVVRQHLDQALGRTASRILVNDICLSNNAGNNVFTHTVNGEKRFTLIDQPFTWLPYGVYRTALLALQMRSRFPSHQAGFTDSRV
mgnify:FL=1